jgi:hypothetical protein
MTCKHIITQKDREKSIDLEKKRLDSIKKGVKTFNADEYKN